MQPLNVLAASVPESPDEISTVCRAVHPLNAAPAVTLLNDGRWASFKSVLPAKVLPLPEMDVTDGAKTCVTFVW